MAMAVSYLVMPRKSPTERNEPTKYYAQAQTLGELDFEELCETITSRSTCAETDVYVVVLDILYEVERALKAGGIARLGDLGSLQIGLNNEDAASVKEFSGSVVKGAHLIFRPGRTLTEPVRILDYQQVLTRTVTQVGTGDDGGKDPDRNPDSGGGSPGDEEAPDPTAQLADGSR